MMKLSDLEGRLWREVKPGVHAWEEDSAPPVGIFGRVENADGVMFLCPCGDGHSVSVCFAGRRADGAQRPKDDNGRAWKAVGDTLETLTLTPSIALPCWHGFVQNGQVST